MFGKNLKELRTEKGYTQAELAKEIGVSQGAIYFWEKEINEPTAGYLVKLAEYPWTNCCRTSAKKTARRRKPRK